MNTFNPTARDQLPHLVLRRLGVLVVGLLFLTGCGSTPKATPSPFPELGTRQTTGAGNIVYSASGVSAIRLAVIDEKIGWCFAQGMPARTVTVYVKDGTPDETGTQWINEGGRKIGGRVVSYRPTAILVMPNQLGCIRHEMLHIHFQETTGDPDANHTRPEWKIWPQYEET